MLLPPLLWLVVIELVGLAALPLAHRVFAALPDRGFASAKFLGLVLLAYLCWSTSMLGLTAFTGSTIAALVVVGGGLSWWLWGGRVLATWRETRVLAIAAEATFLAVFVLGTWIRSYNAAIAGQEKPMDFTFLHGLISAASLPAQDLWLSGFGMPYYYFGYLTQSLVAKVVPVDPPVAYNLAVATVLALSAVGAFGIVASLARLAGGGYRGPIVAGCLASFALTVMGNLEALFELVSTWGVGDRAFWTALGIKNLQAQAGATFPPGDGGWWFKAARVIPNIQPDGITEFPYFSFLLGDLHPHYMAIPLALLIIALAAQAVAAPASFGNDWLRLVVAGVVLGAVIPSNTWDVPIFWGTFGLAFLSGVLAGEAVPRRVLLDRLRQLGVIVLIGLLLYLPPYIPGYMSQPLAIGVVTERTMFGSLLVLFGPLLVLTTVAGLVAAYKMWRFDEGAGMPGWLPFAGAAIGLPLVPLGEPTLGLLLASLALWLPVAWSRTRLGAPPAATVAALLVIAGLGSILVPEILYLKDVFGSRMNTVFKLYYDAWIVLAVAAPLLGWELIRTAVPSVVLGVPSWDFGSSRLRRDAEITSRSSTLVPAWLRAVAGGTLVLVVALAVGGAIYPLAATHTKSGGFAGSATLDGAVYLRSAHPDDVAAIEWLRRNAPGQPVVEAVGGSYSDFGRFATFGASPSLIGWAGHESQWRGPTPEIGRRESLARRVYTDPNAPSWLSELQQLGIRFIVLGDMERQNYQIGRQVTLDHALPLVHQSGGTAIYLVPTGPLGFES